MVTTLSDRIVFLQRGSVDLRCQWKGMSEQKSADSNISQHKPSLTFGPDKKHHPLIMGIAGSFTIVRRCVSRETLLPKFVPNRRLRWGGFGVVPADEETLLSTTLRETGHPVPTEGNGILQSDRGQEYGTVPTSHSPASQEVFHVKHRVAQRRELIGL